MIVIVIVFSPYAIYILHSPLPGDSAAVTFVSTVGGHGGHQQRWLEYDRFLLGPGLFSGRVYGFSTYKTLPFGICTI